MADYEAAPVREWMIGAGDTTLISFTIDGGQLHFTMQSNEAIKLANAILDQAKNPPPKPTRLS